MATEPAARSAPLSIAEMFSQFSRWCAKNPFEALLLLSITGTLTYFFGFLTLFTQGGSALGWGWIAANPEGNQEHAKLVPLISLGLVWYHRDKLRAAFKKSSSMGLVPVLIGVLLFVISARTLQPRLALLALPFVLWGVIYFLWGKAVARILLFPCAFLIFMIPIAALEQATFRLQFVITGVIDLLTNLVGVQISTVGTTLNAADGTFQFEIAEGCSGIRSIMAITMLSAVYVHVTQNQLWKKLVIFGSSALFAIIGNIGRIFTVILVAKYINPELASGLVHDNAAFVFFPFAVAAMIGFGKLLNINYRRLAEPKPGETNRPRVTYDY
jgi:exosortase